MTPLMDGLDAIKLLKAKPDSRDIPVIFLTGKVLKLQNAILKTVADLLVDVFEQVADRFNLP